MDRLFDPPPTPFLAYRPGDTWVFPPFSYVDATGAPVDMTGGTLDASLYLKGFATPFALSGLNGSIAQAGAPTLGQFTAVALPALTATAPPDPEHPLFYATVLSLAWTNATGQQTTIAVIPINVLAPRSPSAIQVEATGNPVVSAPPAIAGITLKMAPSPVASVPACPPP